MIRPSDSAGRGQTQVRYSFRVDKPLGIVLAGCVVENNRRARFYPLTPAGRKQLASERVDLERMILAIQKVLGAA